MARVAPVNLAYNVRTLWFDPGELELSAGDRVVVETARGLELGVCASDIQEVSYEEIKKLKSPLKPVVRVASEEDLEQAQRMEQLGREAMPVFREMARQTSEDMHPVSVEYLLDGDKAVFYFESEARIDFRELVRKLAARFHVRIDMRQIGVRDEARIVGGVAHCGQMVCCKRLGGEFNPVSIRMAKDQDLSLNPQKISGLCGRLMCCLRYEDEAYKDFKSRAPKARSTVKTPEGEGKVVELDVPRELVVVRVGDEKPVKVPLAAFEPGEDGARPHEIGEQAWEDAKGSGAAILGLPTNFETAKFTGTDTLAQAGQIHRTKADCESKGALGSSANTHRKPRQRRRKQGEDKQPTKTESARKPRRRRSTKISGGEATTEKVQQPQQKKGSKPSKAKNAGSKEVRPGQRSSSLAREDAQAQGDRKPRHRRRRRGRGQGQSEQSASGAAKGGSE